VATSPESNRIKALESEIGAALFERTSRMVRLTALGERFRAGVRPAHQQLLGTLAECRAVARAVTGQLRVNYLPTVGVEFVTRIVTAFEARYPQCRTVLNTVPIRRGFLPVFTRPTGSAEVALTWSPDGDGQLLAEAGLAAGPVLATEQRAVVVPTGHALARRTSIRLEDLGVFELLNLDSSDLAGVPAAWTPRVTPSGRVLRQTADDIYSLAATSSVSLEDVLTLVARRRGLHLSIRSVLDRFPFPGLVAVPIEDMPPMAVVPVWQKAEETATVRAFVEAAAISAANRRISDR
jgi:DNA-binding transcriptional LysR family regulator